MATRREIAELNAEKYDIEMLKGAIAKGFDINDWLTLKESTFLNMQKRACVFIKEAKGVTQKHHKEFSNDG